MITREIQQKAVNRLNESDSFSGKIENDEVYLCIDEKEFELSEYEVKYQAKMWDEENSSI